jgi:predicted HicB family RNase H-like nuclease
MLTLRYTEQANRKEVNGMASDKLTIGVRLKSSALKAAAEQAAAAEDRSLNWWVTRAIEEKLERAGVVVNAES